MYKRQAQAAGADEAAGGRTKGAVARAAAADLARRARAAQHSAAALTGALRAFDSLESALAAMEARGDAEAAALTLILRCRLIEERLWERFASGVEAVARGDLVLDSVLVEET